MGRFALGKPAATDQVSYNTEKMNQTQKKTEKISHKILGMLSKGKVRTVLSQIK